MNQCSYCNSKQIYHLSNQHIKCAQCHKKYSPKKLQRDFDVISLFCQNMSAKQAQIQLNVNYMTIQKRYSLLRKIITSFLDKEYKNKKNRSTEYDEYIYLKSNNIYDAQNFLTFIYDEKVYNLMLPSLYKFKTYDKSNKDLEKFLFLNKIAKLQSKNSRITQFWFFLENTLKQYKGIGSKNFIEYLKEVEFKFNYQKIEQENILKELWIKHTL